jgi:hypothetical protein
MKPVCVSTMTVYLKSKKALSQSLQSQSIEDINDSKYCLQYKELELHAIHYYPYIQQKSDVIRLGQCTCDKDYEVVNESLIKCQVNVYYRKLTSVESTQRLESRNAQRYVGNTLPLSSNTSELACFLFSRSASPGFSSGVDFRYI